MGWGSILKKVGGAALDIGSSFVPGGSLAKNALKIGLGAAGAGLSANSSQAANNRGVQYGGQMDLAQMLMLRDQARIGNEGSADRDVFDQGIRREEEGRAGRQDAFKALMQAERVTNPGARPQVAGKYSVAPRVASDAERTGAAAMSNEVMARLQGGNPIAAPTRRDTSFQYDPMTTIDARLLQAGGMEKAGNWLGPMLAFLGQQQQATSAPQETHRTPPIMPPPQAGLSSPGVYRRG